MGRGGWAADRDRSGLILPPSAARAGVSVNNWTDDGDGEVVVGQSILNGIPVQLKPAVSATAGE
jgi:hypothetical protein